MPLEWIIIFFDYFLENNFCHGMRMFIAENRIFGNIARNWNSEKI